jgi:hypothetical protein
MSLYFSDYIAALEGFKKENTIVYLEDSTT